VILPQHQSSVLSNLGIVSSSSTRSILGVPVYKLCILVAAVLLFAAGRKARERMEIRSRLREIKVGAVCVITVIDAGQILSLSSCGVESPANVQILGAATSSLCILTHRRYPTPV
jgi:hypothetical protein